MIETEMLKQLVDDIENGRVSVESFSIEAEITGATKPEDKVASFKATGGKFWRIKTKQAIK